ncbi:hypothetical protein MMC25_003793 [Agyrium rufum]|nr:hypothetical protein [Agyrium rufum]
MRPTKQEGGESTGNNGGAGGGAPKRPTTRSSGIRKNSHSKAKSFSTSGMKAALPLSLPPISGSPAATSGNIQSNPPGNHSGTIPRQPRQIPISALKQREQGLFNQDPDVVCANWWKQERIKRSYSPGDIIEANLVEDAYSERFVPNDVRNKLHFYNTRYGPVHIKPRPMVVIRTHALHFVALPMYTDRGYFKHGGQDPEEYVPTVNQDSLLKDFKMINSNYPLLTTLNSQSGSSVIHFAQPVCKRNTDPTLKIGFLKPESLARLNALCRQFVPKHPGNLRYKQQPGQDDGMTAKRIKIDGEWKTVPEWYASQTWQS